MSITQRVEIKLSISCVTQKQQMKNTQHVVSIHGPQGYEPCEIPLLYTAVDLLPHIIMFGFFKLLLILYIKLSNYLNQRSYSIECIFISISLVSITTNKYFSKCCVK